MFFPPRVGQREKVAEASRKTRQGIWCTEAILMALGRYRVRCGFTCGSPIGAGHYQRTGRGSYPATLEEIGRTPCPVSSVLRAQKFLESMSLRLQGL